MLHLQNEVLWDKYWEKKKSTFNSGLGRDDFQVYAHEPKGPFRVNLCTQVHPGVASPLPRSGPQTISSTSPSFCTLLVPHNKTEHVHCKPLGG